MLTMMLTATMLCIVGVAMADNSPVFLWGVDSPRKPTLETVAQKDFAELTAPLLKDTMVVAFLEENLSSKDFLCSNTQTASSCYAHLRGVFPKTYYASVENPIEALRAVAAEREFNSVDKSGKLSTPLTCGTGKVVFITFDSVKEERGAILESHDAAISAISQGIDCPVVFMYLSTPSTAVTSQHRVRRQSSAAAAGPKHNCFRKESHFLICFTTIFIKTITEERPAPKEELTVKAMTISNYTNNKDSSKFRVTLETVTKPITFNISLLDGYFSMGNIVIGGETFRSIGLEAPTDFSFACGNLTLGAIWKSPTEPANKLLKWNSLQFQAPFNSRYNDKFVFGDSWSCTGFFTPAILSGLFVVTIMLIIVFTGICWMMDINTMDRFDDPKGKTITISAAE